MLPFGVNHVDAKRSGRYPRLAFLIYSKSVLQQKSLSSEWSVLPSLAFDVQCLVEQRLLVIVAKFADSLLGSITHLECGYKA